MDTNATTPPNRNQTDRKSLADTKEVEAEIPTLVELSLIRRVIHWYHNEDRFCS